MTFTLVQTSLVATGTTGSGTTNLQTVLPALSTSGNLLVATMQTATGGTPFKCVSQVTPPGNMAASAVGSGGTFAAGTYFWVVTAITAAGETAKSAEVSATIVLNGSASLTWSALPSSVTGIKVYRGTTTGNENVLIATLGRVTSFTDTGTAGSAGSPPQLNTCGVPNSSPGWIFCGLAVVGTTLQCEIWAYPNNPGGLSGATFQNSAGAACRGTIQEWHTTHTWQSVECFPAGAGAAGTGNQTVTMGNSVGSGELGVVLFANHFTANPSSQSWTPPTGWTLILNQANGLGTPWAAYYKVTTGAGAVSVTGNYSTTTNQDAHAGVLVVFKEGDSVASRVGVGGINVNTYTDQASFGFASSRIGSCQEFDHFVGRTMAMSTAVLFQTTEGGTTTSVPSNVSDMWNAGAQVHYAMKPLRATTGGATTTEISKVDTALTTLKQAGINCFSVSFYNEYNNGGQNGPFGNDTNKPSGDPYGSGNTEAQAKANWLTYWANWQPTAAAHGIPAYTKPGSASPKTAVTWQPPAGTLSGVIQDFYMSDSDGKSFYLDNTGVAGVPSLQDVCDGVKNPDGSNASNPPIPLGLGELGRAGGSTTTLTWADVVAWSHNSSGTGHVRDFFKARLTAGKQNAIVCWFTNNLGSVNWIHTPGAGGEDQSGIQTEIQRLVDDLTVSAVTAGNPVITTTSPLPSGQAGVPYSAALAASGGTTPYSWAVTTGALPAGLTLNAATGQITGTASVSGTFSLGFTVTDAAALTGTATLSLTITAAVALTIPAQTLPAGTVGAAYATAVTANGGIQPYTWAVTSGTLPSGLALTVSSGVISGTPVSAATTAFTIGVTDAASNTASRSLSITVVASTLLVTTTQMPAATLNTAYVGTLSAANGTPPYTWALLSGTLPPGLIINGSGTITGVPVVSGTSNFSVQVTDSLSATASQALSITVTVLIPPIPVGSWRFLVAAAQPDGTYLAEIAQAAQRTLFLRADNGQNSQATVEILGDAVFAPEIQELLTDIQVLHGSDLLFTGRVGDTQDTIDSTGHHVLVNAYDYREVLRRRAILPGDTVSWGGGGTPQQTIAWNMIQATQARSGGNLGISQGIGANGADQVLRVVTFQAGDYIGDDIDTIANMDQGFEWAIKPYGQADLRLDVYTPVQGRRNTGVVLSPGDGRVASVVRVTDPSTFGNVLYETGDQSASPVPTPQFLEAAVGSEGRWEIVFGSNLVTSASLVSDAKQRLADNQVLTPAYTVTCFPGTWGGPSDIFLGDTVTMQIHSGRLNVNDQLRVMEMQFDVDPNGVETLTLILGQIPLRLLKVIPKIMKRLSFLEQR